MYKGVARLDEEPDDYIVREMIPYNGGEEKEKEEKHRNGTPKDPIAGFPALDASRRANLSPLMLFVFHFLFALHMVELIAGSYIPLTLFWLYMLMHNGFVAD